ncbi:MAG TPA: hypothetical protein VGF81_15445 [Solirubrobacteraceae bacterium]
MRDRTLHSILEAFTADAAAQLSAETADGAEIEFEVIDTQGRPGSVPLYCYRPLTTDFIGERLGMLSALPTYAPAARGLESLGRLVEYLTQRGEPRIPSEPRERADAALLAFLGRVFSDRSDFGFDPVRFELAYSELERALYDGRAVAVVIAPLLGIALDHGTAELALGDGLSLVRGDSLSDAPSEAVWGETEEPQVLAMLTTSQERSTRPPVSAARTRFRRVLTALRLFERGGYALGPLAWTRTDTGPWRPVPFGGSGRPRLLTLIRGDQEDELRAFTNLVTRRRPRSGELAWALARFEMGCERLAPFETLTDHLMALRALLEPEGPQSGRLSQRLAVICGKPAERAALAERTARTISLERAVIAGLAPGQDGGDALVHELSEHLRALLRDSLCGHLDHDLVHVADELLAEAVTVG